MKQFLFIPKSAVCNQFLVIAKRKFHISKIMSFSTWKIEKDRFLNMPLDEKRSIYTKKEYVDLSKITTWRKFSEPKELVRKIDILPSYTIDASLNNILADKISVYHGDITQLEIDCIVNAANKTLLGGGGVDGVIHKAAGPSLLEECRSLGGCMTGDAKITGGYKLPAKYIIHAVGPRGEQPDLLKSCYNTCLSIMLQKQLKSIAFPCISTGIYGYPREPAAHIAVYAVRKHLEEHHNEIDRVIFCLFLEEDKPLYEGILQSYFPLN